MPIRLCIVLAAAALLPFAPSAARAAGNSAAAAAAHIAVADLPAEGRATYALIVRGGPFPYAKDGSTFGNRERLLPAKPRGYYREYTVPTPGLKHRGARRIVCGGAATPRPPDACYYSADHYQSFRRVIPE